MSAPPATGKNKGPIMDPALCRCCRSIKKCRLLTAEYRWMDKNEIYSDMFMDCFGLLLSHLDGEDLECCICATCVVRLREATAFRHQVLQCEEMFLRAKMDNKEDGDQKVEVKPEPGGSDCGDSVANDVDSDLDMEQNVNPEADMETNTAAHNESETKDVKVPPFEGKTEIQESDAARAKKPREGGKELLSKMQKLRAKLDRMLDKPARAPPKKTKTATAKAKKTQKQVMDHDSMVYANAVTIVHNSYVCPFTNRISIYYCYYCKDQFTNPNELREHTWSHDQTKMFESMIENKKVPKIDITRIDCRLCSEKIDDLESFKRHITNVHDKVIYPVTNEFLKFRLSMNDLTCTECSNTFPYFDLLKKHMIEHFGTFICDMCGACFLEQTSLRTHIKSHSKVEANFPCEICGKNLKSKYSRYLHVATVHEKKPTVNCYKCEASFLSYALRNKHLIEVHGDKRTFPCNLCDKVYNRRKTLMEHNRRNHLKVYKHQCDLCDQRFYLPSRLKEHMATHTGERNFRCEFCDKSYPRLQSLQEHIRSHSSERRFKCDVCNLAFTQNGSLKNHMKNHHHGFEMDGSYN